MDPHERNHSLEMRRDRKGKSDLKLYNLINLYYSCVEEWTNKEADKGISGMGVGLEASEGSDGGSDSGIKHKGSIRRSTGGSDIGGRTGTWSNGGIEQVGSHGQGQMEGSNRWGQMVGSNRWDQTGGRTGGSDEGSDVGSNEVGDRTRWLVNFSQVLTSFC